MHNYSKAAVGVAGATGYSGQELVRLLARHPRAALGPVMASKASADAPPRRLPALARVWDGDVTPLDLEGLAAADAVFLATPEAASAELAPALLKRGVRVLDLSGAFRLRSADARAKWYPASPPELPAGAVYGLAELHQPALRTAPLVACPGCYPTAALLALTPLRDAGLFADDPSIVIDAKSGVSGAGKTPTERTHFSECHGNVARTTSFHRHGAEIEQELGSDVTFVPHLVPLDRGILERSTCVCGREPARPISRLRTESAYARAPFVRLRGETLPEIKHVAWTNFCDLGWRVSRDRAVIVSTIDNLLKGAAGQAVQAFNVAFGLDECAGLL